MNLAPLWINFRLSALSVCSMEHGKNLFANFCPLMMNWKLYENCFGNQLFIFLENMISFSIEIDTFIWFGFLFLITKWSTFKFLITIFLLGPNVKQMISGVPNKGTFVIMPVIFLVHWAHQAGVELKAILSVHFWHYGGMKVHYLVVEKH